MFPLKQSTTHDILFFAHDTSGAAVTGKVDGDFTKRISKNGAAFGAMTVTITERESGKYHMQLSTSHTDTLGGLSIHLTASGIMQVNLEYRVHARIFDDLAYPNTSGRGMDVDATGGVEITADQNVNVNQWRGGSPNVLVSGRVDTSTGAMAANVLTATALDSTATNEIRDSILSDSTAFAGANVDAAISTRATPAQVNTEVDTALSDIGLDHLLSAAVIGTDVTDNSIVARLVSSAATADWDTYANTTDSLQAIRDKETDIETDTQDIQSRLPAALVSGRIDASVGAMAANVLTATALDSTATNEIRDSILSDSTPFAGANVDAAITTRATPAQVNTECDTALSDIGLDHLLGAAVIGTDVTDNSIFARLVSASATADWDDFANTTDSLQAIRDKEIDIETDTQDIQSRLPAALVAGHIDASIEAQTVDVDINMAQTTPGSPTADTVGEALRKAHQQLPEGPQKNAAFSNIMFLMVDETDHFTPETGLTVTGQRSLDGAAFAAVTGSIAEVGNGIYQFDAVAADMNADVVLFRFSSTGAADTFFGPIKTTPAP